MGKLIITDHNLQVIPQETVYRPIDELTSFADLLLRWPFRSFYLVSQYAGLETPENPGDYALQMRLAHSIGLRRKIPAELMEARAKAEAKKSGGIVEETDIVVALWNCTKNWHRLDTVFTNADMLYFDLAQVEAVEKEYPECRIIDLAKRTEHPLNVTTRKNIREVAALALYHWEIIGGIKGERFYYRDDALYPGETWGVSDTIHFPEAALRKLPRDRTWPDLPTIRPEKRNYKRNNELSEPKRRLEELRRLGIWEKYKLAEIILMVFPELTRAEIAELIPGSENTITSYNSKRSRGRDLLKKGNDK